MLKNHSIILLFLSDLPMILSGSNLAYLEPHKEIWKDERGQWQAGEMYNVGEQADKLDTFAPFIGYNGYHRGIINYKGTFFRFPLRINSSDDRVSSNVYAIKKLGDLLGALRKEAKVILLFLRSVREVEVHEISEKGDYTDLLKVACVLEESQYLLKANFLQQLRTAYKLFLTQLWAQ